LPWSNSSGYNFTETSIKTNAPQLSGVYGLYSNQTWIYIGESGNIQERLLQHRGGDNECINRWNPPSFSYELVSANLRVARQNQLILELNPACNQKLG
jgi:hypothetical protein